MRIIDGFRLRCVGGQHFVLGEGLAQLHYHKVISLNPAGAFLWKAVEEKEFTEDDLVQLLLKEYTEKGMTEEMAREGASSIIRSWTELELIV